MAPRNPPPEPAPRRSPEQPPRPPAPLSTDHPTQPHCADHPRFHPACPTCKQASANAQPYPLRQPTPVPRSFGFTDDLTAADLRALNPKLTNLCADDPNPSLSLTALRLLRRLIWPI